MECVFIPTVNTAVDEFLVYVITHCTARDAPEYVRIIRSFCPSTPTKSIK